MKNISLKTMVIFSIMVFILSFGATYAINVWGSGNTLISGTTRCFKVDYTKGQDINFGSITSGTGLVAQTSFSKDDAVSTTLTISRNSDCDICGSGSISANITSSIDLSSGGLSYKVYREITEVKSGSITKNGITVLYDDFDIKNVKTITYTIYFYLDSNKINNNYLKTNFTGKIYAEANSTSKLCNSEKDLYDNITKDATLDTSIDFSQISSDTNGKGIYKRSGTENDTYPIYYYRGAVDNNNVIFANFCWKIVRTTEIGGVKLIYNGKPSNGTCNNTGTSTRIGKSTFNTNVDNNAYVGYMYGDINGTSYEEVHKNINNSAIKDTLDNWYSTKMTDYTEKLEDTVWCNDREVLSGTGIGTDVTSYKIHSRTYSNNSPTFNCSQGNDRFTVSTSNGNGALIYPVGLITADEVRFAGAVYGKGNKSFYLFTGDTFWTMSARIFDGNTAFGLLVGSNNSLSNLNVSYSLDVRPSISLAIGVTYSKGDGTANSPYVID